MPPKACPGSPGRGAWRFPDWRRRRSVCRPDLPLLGTEIDLQDHQLVGVGMGLGRFDGGDLEFDLAKIVDRDHEQSLCRGARDEMKIAEAARQKKRANRLDFGAVFPITGNHYY